MLPERRAIVFDMDDTLYPYRRFVVSGFVAVAAHLERTWRIDRRLTLRRLLRARRGEAPGREIQTCVAECRAPDALVPVLVRVLREHQPALTLPRSIAGALGHLRAAGWRIGVLTNGPRAMQARKAAALGIARHVDTIVYAADYGSGAGKPEPEPFAAVLGRLGVPPSSAVFVGDDEVCDIVGAASAGLATVRCEIWRADGPRTAADAVVQRASDLPRVAEGLLQEVSNHHAA